MEKKEVRSIVQSCKFPYASYAHSCRNAIGLGAINYLEKGFLISDHFASTFFFSIIEITFFFFLIFKVRLCFSC